MVFTAIALVTIALAPPRRAAAAAVNTSSTAILPSLVLSVIGSLALYWPALTGGLLSDDYVLTARAISEITDPRAWEHYRPLPLLVWMGLLPWGGPTALHVLNVVLHGLNAWGVFVLAVRLGHAVNAGAIAGLIFLTFPAAVEPVAWNSGIFDVALVSLGLLYLWFIATPGAAGPALVCLAAALLTKETAVALPAVAFILQGRGRTSRRGLIASAVLTGAYIALRIAAGLALPEQSSRPLRYVLKEALVRPFASLSVPWTGHELAAHPALGVSAVILLTSLVYLYCLRSTRRWHPLTGVAIVLAAVLPLWQLFFVGENLDGSRYLYLPLVGWSLLLIDLIPAGGRARVPALVATLLLAPLGAWGVRHHLLDWDNAARMRERVIAGARHELARNTCSRVEFRDVPEIQGGAYVFRNGLTEAARVEKLPLTSNGAPCTLAWRGDRFERIQ